MPQLTVLLPVYNGGGYLRLAIESILNQTFRDFQLLIVDDGSTDNSQEIARSYADPRIRIISNDKNLGLPGALNRGLLECNSTLIARQDADDTSHPRRLEIQLAYLKAHPDVALLGTQGRVINASGRFVAPIDVSCEHLSIRWELLFGNCFIHSSVLFRREMTDNLGGYASVPYCQDYDLWSRAAVEYKVANVPTRLVDHRSLPSSMTARLTGIDDEARKVSIMNLRSVFPTRAFSAAEVDLVCAYLRGVPGESVETFLKFFEMLLAEYQAMHPFTRHSLDFRRTIARQLGWIASTAPSPVLALSIFAKSLSHYPGFALSTSGIRSLARVLAGPRGRSAISTLRTSSTQSSRSKESS